MAVAAYDREQQYGATLPPMLEPGGVLNRDYTPEESMGRDRKSVV